MARGGKLLAHFITVSNIESRDPAKVRAGNERVVRPRLSDAAFFWSQDRKQPLAARRDGTGCGDVPGESSVRSATRCNASRRWPVKSRC